MEVDPRWYETFFGDDYLRVAVNIPEDRTEKQVAFVAEKLELAPGARVLDLACGHGRHAVPLAGRGFRVTGVDYSAPSIELARRRAAEAGVEAEFVVRDMREIEYDAEFDAVLNLFTAFGYFADEADDRRVLERVSRALVAGGPFVLDTVNVFAIACTFQHQAWDELDDGTVMLEDRSYDFRTGRSTAAWTFLMPGGERRELRHSVRLYTLPELRAMLEAAGLELEAVWGNWEGDEYSFEGRRLIALARKP